MKSNSVDRPQQDAESSEVPLRVSARSYRRFADWMDHELTKLEARWHGNAAPRAKRAIDFRFRWSMTK